MNDQQHISDEIQRLALHTTDSEAMALFNEQTKLGKQAQMWRVVGFGIGVVTTVVVFTAFLSNQDYGLLESCFIGIALFGVSQVIARKVLTPKVQSWLQRADAVVQRKQAA